MWVICVSVRDFKLIIYQFYLRVYISIGRSMLQQFIQHYTSNQLGGGSLKGFQPDQRSPSQSKYEVWLDLGNGVWPGTFQNRDLSKPGPTYSG